MRKLVHLSDLHFNSVDPHVVAEVVRLVAELEPHVVVVSGDLTQRAKRRQFVEARAFLDSLPRPLIAVPGNHDVPLHNLLSRFVFPLRRYRRLITDNLRPFHADGEIAVFGVDTTRSLTVKGGAIRRSDIRWIRDTLPVLGDRIVKVVVAHHPFDTPPHRLRRPDAGRRAADSLTRAGVDVFLTGHLHTSYTGPTALRYDIDGRSAVVVEAGTATSLRVRDEPNAFNVLHLDPAHIVVERYTWDAASKTFQVRDRQRFENTTRGWLPAVA